MRRSLAILAVGVDRLADYSSTMCAPDPCPTQSGVCTRLRGLHSRLIGTYIEAVTTSDYVRADTREPSNGSRRSANSLQAIANPSVAKAIRASAITDADGLHLTLY